MNDLPLSFDDIARAHERIAGAAHRTPVLTSRTADELVGAQLFFKCENFQRMGAFKFRGAYNALSQFSPEQRARGVVTFSSGNHAQAVALSARLLGMRYTEDREAIGKRLAQQQGLTLIPPYDHLHVMAGQGTCAKELIEQSGALDVLLVPLGGGGLLSGCATAAKAMNPGCVVIGVEPEAGNDGQCSLRSGQILHIDTPDTIADGAQTQHLGQLTFPVLQQRVDDILTVSDSALVEAMKFFASRMKIVVEPTGCLGAALAFSGQLDLRGKKVGVVVSGGNIDLMRFAALVEGRI
jgi:threonine dehydratase